MSNEILDLVKARIKPSSKKLIIPHVPDEIDGGEFSRLHAGIDVSRESSVSVVSVWVSTLTSKFNERGRKFVESKVI